MKKKPLSFLKKKRIEKEPLKSIGEETVTSSKNSPLYTTEQLQFINFFSKLPDEMLMSIFFFERAPDLLIIMQVCKKFSRLIDREVFWKFSSIFQLGGNPNEEEVNPIIESYINDLYHWKKVYQFIYLCEDKLKKEKNSNSKDNTHNFKMCLLGATNTGKSSFVLRLVRGDFFDYQESTIGAAFLTLPCCIDGIDFQFDIWDTAGHDKYKSLTEMYVRDAAVVLIMYSVTSKKTFEEAKQWIERIKKFSNYSDIIIRGLVGTKCDLEREVSREKGKALARKYDMLFFECSSKTNYNILEGIMEVGKQLNLICNSRINRLERKLREIERGDIDEFFFLNPQKPSNSNTNKEKKCIIQ